MIKYTDVSRVMAFAEGVIRPSFFLDLLSALQVIPFIGVGL